MLRIVIVLFSLGATAAAAESCLKELDSGLSIDASEPGAAQVSWHALIENRCQQSQDAIVRIQFIDNEGKAHYEVRDQFVVQRLGRHKAGREVYVPASVADSISDIRLRLEERERPY